MRCPNCGSELLEGSAFCSSCGTAVDQSAIDRTDTVSNARDFNKETGEAVGPSEPGSPEPDRLTRFPVRLGVGIAAGLLALLLIGLLLTSGRSEPQAATDQALPGARDATDQGADSGAVAGIPSDSEAHQAVCGYDSGHPICLSDSVEVLDTFGQTALGTEYLEVLVRFDAQSEEGAVVCEQTVELQEGVAGWRALGFLDRECTTSGQSQASPSDAVAETTTTTGEPDDVTSDDESQGVTMQLLSADEWPESRSTPSDVTMLISVIVTNNTDDIQDLRLDFHIADPTGLVEEVRWDSYAPGVVGDQVSWGQRLFPGTFRRYYLFASLLEANLSPDHFGELVVTNRGDDDESWTFRLPEDAMGPVASGPPPWPTANGASFSLADESSQEGAMPQYQFAIGEAGVVPDAYPPRFYASWEKTNTGNVPLDCFAPIDFGGNGTPYIPSGQVIKIVSTAGSCDLLQPGDTTPGASEFEVLLPYSEDALPAHEVDTSKFWMAWYAPDLCGQVASCVADKYVPLVFEVRD